MAFEFEVVPDDQADDVERRRKARERAFEELERSPGLSVLHASFWPEEVRAMAELQPKGKLDDMADLHGEAQAYLGPFELPEPDEDEVAEVRAVAERAG